MAHDLNNILAGIINLPEIMLLTLDKNDELHHSLQSIKQSGERAAAVVADLLTIARGSVAAREPLALNQLIEDYLQRRNSSVCASCIRTSPSVSVRRTSSAAVSARGPILRRH